ncbi:trafficking protein particle complex subunit 2-like [Hibiscus syriacus]|uniref:trafficking protein particle complex subunit 2-like n=1 Tax=Hibiscus syriacus TaxID=106335 RepID=UPI001924211F|nr:trafficking protein particle complex subunit 2-like [Hibiscus syriacus]
MPIALYRHIPISHTHTRVRVILVVSFFLTELLNNLQQFVLHAALDIVQDLAWTTSAMFLKAIDKFNDLVVSVYVTADHILYNMFPSLHDLCYNARSEDGIKSFFQEVHELYIKSLLNPLYLPGSRITSSHFDTKVHALARKHL